MRYELIHEIANRCAGNQMRDVTVSAVETDDPAAYVLALFADKDPETEVFRGADGSVRVDLVANGIRHRFEFSPD